MFSIEKLKPMYDIMFVTIFKMLFPILDKRFIKRFFTVIDNVKGAVADNNRPIICQYRCVFVILLTKLVHLIYVQNNDMTLVETLIHYDPYKWVDADEFVYLISYAYMLITCYFIHLIYFSSKSNFFIDSARKVFYETDSVKYNWPYFYKKHQSCGRFILRIANFLLKYFSCCGFVGGIKKFELKKIN